MDSIGSRVLERIEKVRPGALQRDIAAIIGMTPDAFSRATRGQRQFSSIELARLADLLDADLYWLTTGRPDPHQLRVAARHNFDHNTGERYVPGLDGDRQTLENIALAYRQAYPATTIKHRLPTTAADARTGLGPDFVRPFTDRLEQAFGINVVRVKELSTAYSFSVGGRHIIAVPATGNWFRENWDLAHELGHLAKNHHDNGLSAEVSTAHEATANAFAADLLLPKDVLLAVDWDNIKDIELADYVWHWGVSVDVLARRLSRLMEPVPLRVAHWATHPTQRLLRKHLQVDSEIDQITTRMDDASQRRFPLALQEAHLERIASGEIGKGTLAWMLGIDADALDVDVPEQPEIAIDDLTQALGL